MTISGKSALIATLLAVHLTAGAFADNGSKILLAASARGPAVGDRWFQVDEEIQKIRSKVTIGAQDPRNEDVSKIVKYRVVHETLAVAGKTVTKERVTIERWSALTDPKEPEDKSLSGKTVVIDRAGVRPKVVYEGGDNGVTVEAKKWVEQSLAKFDPMAQVDKIFPAAPVEPDSEWTLDTKKLADEIFKGTEIDGSKSSAKGVLKNVHEENGIKTGDIEIKILLQLKQVLDNPVEWKEGGLVDLTITVQGSLEPEKSRKRSVRMDLKLAGRADQESTSGTISVKMDMKIQTNLASGDMPK
jgi:hypothetical protein